MFRGENKGKKHAHISHLQNQGKGERTMSSVIAGIAGASLSFALAGLQLNALAAYSSGEQVDDKFASKYESLKTFLATFGGIGVATGIGFTIATAYHAYNNPNILKSALQTSPKMASYAILAMGAFGLGSSAAVIDMYRHLPNADGVPKKDTPAYRYPMLINSGILALSIMTIMAVVYKGVKSNSQTISNLTGISGMRRPGS